MELGIMEFTAIENLSFGEGPPVLDELPCAAIGYYGVYFRHEYFGRVPPHLLPAVQEAMAVAGGYDFQPDQRTITALHHPRLYAGMCREILALVHDWMNAEIFLSD